MISICDLLSLSDIKWNIPKVTDKHSIFYDCLNCLNKKLLLSRIYKNAATYLSLI